MTNEIGTRFDRKRWVAPVMAVGMAALAGLSGIAGWFIGDGGKLSEAEAAGTANAVGTAMQGQIDAASLGCSTGQGDLLSTQAALIATSEYWQKSSDQWGARALTAEAILTGTPPVPSATVLPVTITNIPEGWVCSAPTETMTPRLYVPATTATDTATATRTATGTMTPTLALRNTDIPTAINTRPVPTDTMVFVPTDTPQAPTDLPVPTNTPRPVNTDTPVPQNTPTERSTTPPQTPIPTP